MCTQMQSCYPISSDRSFYSKVIM